MAIGYSLGGLIKRLGTSAFLDVGKGTGQVAAGDDSRIIGALQKANNLDDLANIEQARKNLGVFPNRGSLAQMDLNDVDGNFYGIWLQSGAVPSNGHYPTSQAGSLAVYSNGGKGCTQVYYPYNNNEVFFIRNNKGGAATWTPWTHYYGGRDKNTSSPGTGGWWKCGDTGFMLQWGTRSRVGEWNTQVNFPVKFPNTCSTVVASLNFSGQPGGRNIAVFNVNTSGFTCYMAEEERQIMWMAIGR